MFVKLFSLRVYDGIVHFCEAGATNGNDGN